MHKAYGAEFRRPGCPVDGSGWIKAVSPLQGCLPPGAGDGFFREEAVAPLLR